MDPEETLRLMRAALDHFEKTRKYGDEYDEYDVYQAADKLAEHVGDLLGWTDKGGFLPARTRSTIRTEAERHGDPLAVRIEDTL